MLHQKIERGQALILIVLGIVGLVAITALAIDAGNSFSDRRHAQNAADTAALAAALAKTKSQDFTSAAVARAVSNGYADGENGATVTVSNPPAAGCDGTNGPYAGNTEYIQVIIHSTVDTYFGPVVNINQLYNCVEAIASAKLGTFGAPGDGNAIMTLGTSGVGFKVTGSGNVMVNNGGIFVNSNNSTKAFWKTGSGNVNVIGGDDISVVGGSTKSGSGSVTPWPPSPATQITDPLAAFLNPPANPGACQDGFYSGSGTHTFNPGCYTRLKVTGSGDVILNPGIYYITGGDYDLSGSGDITALGVMIYLDSGSYKMTGSGNFTISAPTSGDYAGLTVYMDRNSTGSYSMTGSGASSFTGTVYAPNAAATLTGSGGTRVVNSQVISKSLVTTGSGALTIDYDPDENYQIPSPPIIELTK